jgi:undecaprenyl-diphosphatase
MEFIKVIILGVVQGLTEFLPISSSGHLVLFRNILNFQEAGLVLDVFLHFGTLIAVSIFYWDDIKKMITFKAEYRKFSLYIILGSIPAGVVGILFEDVFAKIFTSIRLVGFTLLFTGLLLWLSDRVGGRSRGLEDMDLSDSLAVGFAQAFAIIPGISRSGSTIVAGLLKGLDRKTAAKFSFLLSIPVILGATLLQIKNFTTVGLGEINLVEVLAGTLAAMISGYFAIGLLVKLIKQERLSLFAYYCWGLGLLIILFY